MIDSSGSVLGTDHIDCTFAEGWWEDPAYAIDMESETEAAR